jgi:hypothetical protein
VFVPCRPFHDSIVFAGKAGAYPREAPFRCSTPGHAHKQQTRLERFTRSSVTGKLNKISPNVSEKVAQNTKIYKSKFNLKA